VLGRRKSDDGVENAEFFRVVSYFSARISEATFPMCKGVEAPEEKR